MKRALEHVYYDEGVVRLGSVVEDDHPAVAHGRFEDLDGWAPRDAGVLKTPDIAPNVGELLESVGLPIWASPVAAFLGGLLGAVLGSLL